MLRGETEADINNGSTAEGNQNAANMIYQQGWAIDDDFAQGGGSCAYFTEHMSSANSFCGNNPSPSQDKSKQKISPTPGYQSIQGNNQTAPWDPTGGWVKPVANHLNIGSFVPSVGAATPWHHPDDTSVSNATFGDDMRWNPTAHMIPGKALVSYTHLRAHET